jgi:CheY-like chemotaxis protein
MGGRVEAASDGPGRGSTFSFTIVAPVGESPAARQREFVGVQPALEGKRLLVVDDNATNRRVLELQAAKWGMGRARGRIARRGAGLARRRRVVRRGDPRHAHARHGRRRARPRHSRARRDAAARAVQLARPARGRRGRKLFAAFLQKPIRQSQLFDTLAGLFAGDAAPQAARTAPARIDAALAERHPLRILVAEDNVVNQKLALRILQQMGLSRRPRVERPRGRGVGAPPGLRCRADGRADAGDGRPRRRARDLRALCLGRARRASSR